MVWWVGYWMAATVATGLALLISLQAWEHRRFVRSRIAHPHTSGPTGHALVVVACKGSDGGLEANLRPLFEQTYADYQLVFAVEGACDPCCGVIRQLQTQYPHRQTRLIFAGLSSDCGQKVHNLLAATDAMSRDVAILAFIDADVRPARKWLSRLTQRLDRFNVATGYRWFIPERPSLPNNLLASIDSAVISLMFPGKHSLVWGGSWAIRRDTFDRLPLRQAWQGTLSDDLVASCVLAQAREPVALEPACIVTSPLDVDCAEMFAFLRRQLTIGRHYAPRLWGMMLVLTCLTQSMLWVSLATATWGICQRATWAWQPALVAALLYGLHAFRAWLRQEASCSFVSRRWAGVAAARRFDQWAAPLAGAVCSLGLLCSATGRQIVWKGITYEMGTAGRVLRIVHRSASPRERAAPSSKRWKPTKRFNNSGSELPAFVRTHTGRNSTSMRVVLWDTRQNDVAKDFAGGFGVGQYPGQGGLGGRLIRHYFKRDKRPTALVFAYLAAIFRALGHQVEYSLDRVPVGADLYLFNPAMMTVGLERKAMAEALKSTPGCRVFVTGAVANAMPEAFEPLEVTILQGEAEQLFWKLDEALACGARSVELGTVADLDLLPFPDWSLFAPRTFRVGFDFSRFPTAYIQQSRGCTLKCNYCPYILLENKTRLRSPESVVAEMRAGIKQHGFRSFKFRDPLFGVDRARVFRLADLIGQLPRKIQFSIESRIDVLRADVLRALRAVGLTSVTVGVETPSEDTLRRYHRAPIRDDRQHEFMLLCRSLGIRAVAGFMVGFPDDTEESIHAVLRYAKALNPTFANFNIVTPYPGTEFFREIKSQIATFDPALYSVYTPVLRYRHLTPERVSELHARCFASFYFRSRWLLANAGVIWPVLTKLGVGRTKPPQSSPHVHVGPPQPHTALHAIRPSATSQQPKRST